MNMSKRKFKVFVNQLTQNGEYRYPWISQYQGEALFTSSFDTCYFDNRTFKKIKGCGPKGGNYKCVEDNEEYRISRRKA